MNEDPNFQPPPDATTLTRMSLVPMRWDTVAIHFTVAAPANSRQTVTMDVSNYQVGNVGSGTADSRTGIASKLDAFLTSRYDKGLIDENNTYRIWAVGFQFLGSPFVASSDVADADTLTGSFIDNFALGEYFANMVIMGFTMRVKSGTTDEVCSALISPIGFLGDGSVHLGDNAATAHSQNALRDNKRYLGKSVLSAAVDNSKKPIFSLERNSLRISYSSTTPINVDPATGLGREATVYQLLNLTYYGEPAPGAAAGSQPVGG